MSTSERMRMKWGVKNWWMGVKTFDFDSSKSQLQFAPRINSKSLKLAEIVRFKIHVDEMHFLDTVVEKKNDAL